MDASESAAQPSTMSKLTRIPPLLYGTAWKAEATTALVLQALASGFRGVDVAGQPKHYREDLVGDALQLASRDLGISRESLWVQTKFTSLGGQDRNKPLPYDAKASVRTAVRQSFQNSLRNLHKGDQWIWDDDASKAQAGKRPWIDSYLLHSPLDTLEATAEAWSAMEDLVVEGKVRQIGFSNVYDPRIFAVLRSTGTRVGPAILQNRWHHTSGHDVSLLPLLSPTLSPNDFPLPGASSPKQGITYQPFWTLTGNPRLLSSEGVIRSAIKHDWTPQQVVYRFVAQGFGVKGIATTVLCGSTDEAHMREAVHALLGDEALDEDEVDEIRRGIYGE